MAMAEQPWCKSASYHSPNPNSCQDLAHFIQLLLGLIICVNIGINLVTLLWHRLRGFLHHMFYCIICEKEASKSSSPEWKTQPPKQSSPAVHLRCTMDPVQMTLSPPRTRHRHRRRRRFSARSAHHPLAWAPDTDEEKLPHQDPAICTHNWNHTANWEGPQSTQEFWPSWAQGAVEPPSQTIRFQQTIEDRPLKREMWSDLGLEACVYPVNPPPTSPHVLGHKTCEGAGEEGEQEQCSPALPAPPPVKGPAIVPEIPRHRSSGHIAYDARDVRRRLRELTREVDALSHCYPVASRSNVVEGVAKNWVYRPVTER